LTVANIETVEGSKMNLVNGEKITVLNLLYGMMLPSGNDAAYTIAKNYPGGVEGFVGAMNKQAHDLQLSNTKYFDPDGYDDQNYTTAFDMARLGAFAMKNSLFSKIVGTKHLVVADTSGKIVHNLNNLNELLGLPGVTGIKTGFTNEAGGVLVTSLNLNNKSYIIVVLDTPDRFGDTATLMKKVLSGVKSVEY